MKPGKENTEMWSSWIPGFQIHPIPVVIRRVSRRNGRRNLEAMKPGKENTEMWSSWIPGFQIHPHCCDRLRPWGGPLFDFPKKKAGQGFARPIRNSSPNPILPP
jgi:hypothetical protein